jgi:hypothetical protein
MTIHAHGGGYGYGGRTNPEQLERQREHSQGIRAVIHQAVLQALANGPLSPQELFSKVRVTVPNLDSSGRTPTHDEIREALWDEEFRSKVIELTPKRLYRLRD